MTLSHKCALAKKFNLVTQTASLCERVGCGGEITGWWPGNKVYRYYSNRVIYTITLIA